MKSPFKAGQDVYLAKAYFGNDGKIIAKVTRAVYDGVCFPSWVKGDDKARLSVRVYQKATGKPGDMDYAYKPENVFTSELAAKTFVRLKLGSLLADTSAAIETALKNL